MNILERLSILSPGGPVEAGEVTRLLPQVPATVTATPGYQEGDPRSLRERMDDYERALIRGALEGSRGSMAEAGRRLQTDRANLYRRMRRLGIREDAG